MQAKQAPFLDFYCYLSCVNRCFDCIHSCTISTKHSLWGYSVDDIPWLKAEIERQALEKYLSGDYTLGKLDRNGQRINIRIAIERRDTGEIVTFLSGWMARPNGHLQMTTPYGDD